MLTLLTNMPRAELIAQLKDGLILMVLGMGTVFVFLTILIFTTKGLSAVCRRIAPAPAPKAAVSKPVAQSSAVSNDSEIAAAIAVAYAKSKN